MQIIKKLVVVELITEVKQGVCFQYEGKYYLKIVPLNSDSGRIVRNQAVNMSTGMVAQFSVETKVVLRMAALKLLDDEE